MTTTGNNFVLLPKQMCLSLKRSQSAFATATADRLYQQQIQQIQRL